MDGPSGQSRLKEWWSTMPTDQKIAVAILSLCSVVTVGFAWMQMRSQLTQPFLVPNSVLAKAQELAKQNQGTTDEELKTRDTDHDGLNDYVEKNVYGTSPYLADSDSDGVIDSVELSMGTNPNCPKGKNCSLLPTTNPDAAGKTGTSTDSFQDLLNIATNNAGVNSGASGSSSQSVPLPADNLPSVASLQASGGSSGSLKGTLLPPDQMTPAMLRKYMLDNNLATADQLNQLTDTQLQQLYVQAYAQVTQSSNTDSAANQLIAPSP